MPSGRTVGVDARGAELEDTPRPAEQLVERVDPVAGGGLGGDQLPVPEAQLDVADPRAHGERARQGRDVAHLQQAGRAQQVERARERPATGVLPEVRVAPEQQVDPHQQLAQGRALGDVVRRAELVRVIAAPVVVPAGEEHDRDLADQRVAAHAPAQLEAVQARHAGVGHDQPRSPLEGVAQGRLAVAPPRSPRGPAGGAGSPGSRGTRRRRRRAERCGTPRAARGSSGTSAIGVSEQLGVRRDDVLAGVVELAELGGRHGAGRAQLVALDHLAGPDHDRGVAARLAGS